MKKTVAVCVSLVGGGLAAPLLLAVAVATSLPHLALDGQRAATGMFAPCRGPGLETPVVTADTPQVQHQAGMALCVAPGDPSPASAARGSAALAYAEAQVGTPYQWGGERAGVGFDCSGLAQAAWRSAGISIPRVAQEQFYAGPRVPQGEALQPGDLVFFGGGPNDVTHVGIVADPAGEMIDAPHKGALVRVDSFSIIPGNRWGGDLLVGATRPGGA